ncbi:MAG TPA: arsenate reductase ArsC [Steroidobacteraceae bacterium]|nr:arsenate reductase ArsC [Steroidobacteraceae bacterium]
MSAASAPQRNEDAYSVLFLCTRNASRGILAEALLRERGGGRFIAHSAGSRPSGELDPHAKSLLERLDIPTEDLRSKSWNEFGGVGAQEHDFIITLCDSATGETCPEWPGHPITASWSIPDPAVAAGSEIDKANAFRDVFAMLERRISLFMSLPLDSLDKLARETQTRAVARG